MKYPLQRLKTAAGKKWQEKYAERMVRIWSGEWGMYWRQSRGGYTYDSQTAGVFALSDAIQYSGHCGPEKRISYELIK